MDSGRPRDARAQARFREGTWRHDGPFRDSLGHRCADTAGARARVERSGVSLGHHRSDPPGAPCTRDRATRDALRDCAVGERRPETERRAHEFDDIRRLRLRGREALPVRPQVDDLERAEPAAVARGHVPRPVREAAAQSRLRGDPSREPQCTRRRRCHRAARQHRRLRPTRMGARHGEGAREDRRVRAQPVRDAPARVAVPRSVPVLRRHLDGEPEPAHQRGAPGLRQQADLADRVRLPNEPAGSLRRQPECAGAVRERVGAARVPAARCHDADPVPRPRRAGPRALPERPLHRARRRQARVPRVSLSARAGLTERLARVALGTDPAGQGRAYVPAAGCGRAARGAGSGRRSGRTAAASSRQPRRCRAARSSACGRPSTTRTAGRCLFADLAYDRAL